MTKKMGMLGPKIPFQERTSVLSNRFDDLSIIGRRNLKLGKANLTNVSWKHE